MDQHPKPFRVLIVDDNPAIHEDFRKILLNRDVERSALADAETVLFGTPPRRDRGPSLELESAFQGKEALEKVNAAVLEDRPYALAFVDVRMPPGWDGVETIARLWKADPLLQAVICTAYSDYSWELMAEHLGESDKCLILKKPFDNIEVLQMAHTLTRKWQVTKQAHLRLETLEAMVAERTVALRQANTELHRSEERFSTAFRASPAALAIQTFAEERFVDVNEAFCRMTGFSREELVGRAPTELQLTIEYSSGPIPVVGIAQSKASLARISSKPACSRHALLSVERITLGGEPHILLLAQDVSEQMRLETQLRQSQKMEAIGQLAAGVAHDFNNLLTIIQGHSSLQLAMPGHNPDLLASLQQIEQAAARAADLTRQLLTFSRRQIVQPRIIDFGEHVACLGTMLRRLIGEQIEFHCNLPASLPPVCADPTNLEQVVINLVVNARDAVAQGGRIELTLCAVSTDFEYCRANPEAAPGNFVCLSVEDNGIGMDEATRTRIFEPFFTTKEIHKGTGMGLSLVYGIARQHAGWVEVQSTPGKGSRFRVYFPIATGKPERTRVAEVGRSTPARRHTILVVEDDVAVRRLVKEVLAQNNYEVIEAENADRALTLWETHRDRVELLLTDMVMPGSMNGLELARQLHAERPDLTVIYTSGYSSELFGSDVELKDGINYLPKPYLSSKLTAMLRNALEREASAPDQSPQRDIRSAQD